MPLGELFIYVWLVLLALNLMHTFPRCSHCSSSFTTSHPSATFYSPSSSSSIPATSNAASSPSSPLVSPALLSFSSSSSQLLQQDQKSTAAANKATSFSSASELLCIVDSIDPSQQLISTDCEQLLQKQHQPRMRITGDINEGPGPPSCPTDCSGRKSNQKNSSSCYRYLVPKDCEEPWHHDWSEIRFRYCCEHSIREAMPNPNDLLNDRQQCERHVNKLLELDLFVAKITCQFEQALTRYDCLQRYSVNSCQTCRDAYRRWVCASLIPHWKQRHRIKPCRSICHAVEQTCPWFLPAEKPGYPAQYAGEPIFQCIDSNIPETGNQLKKSTYGSGCCYEYCEQHRNVDVSSGSRYHHPSDNSKFSFKRIGFCESGCNDSTSSASAQDSALASPPSTPCRDTKTESSADTSTVALSSSSNGNTARPTDKQATKLPLVNFPLSSCQSSHTGHLSTHHRNTMLHSTATRKTLSNLIMLWFVFYLFFVSTKLIDLR